MSTAGRFVTFEGIEGVGKTTQVARLSAALNSRGLAHVVTREPGGTPLAESIRQVVLTARDETMPPAAELLLAPCILRITSNPIFGPAGG